LDLIEPSGITLDAIFGKYVKFLVSHNKIESLMTERILKYSIHVIEAFNDIRNNKSFAHDNPILNYSESVLIFNNLTNSDKLVNRIFFVDTCLMDYKKDYDILKLRDTLTNEIIWYKQDRKVNSSLFSIYYPNEEMMSDVNLKLHKFKKTNRTSQTLNFVGGVLSVIGTSILIKNPTSKASKPFYVLSGVSFILGYGFYLKSYDYLSIN
jgi:hypothetical protein